MHFYNTFFRSSNSSSVEFGDKYGEGEFMAQGRSCGFVCWAKAPFSQNVDAVTHHLLNLVNQHEENGRIMNNNNRMLEDVARKLKNECKRLKIMLLLSWMVFIFYYFQHD